MQRQIFLALVFVCLLPAALWSCDACGCSAAGNGIGLLSDTRSNLVGVRWQRIGFQGGHYDHGGALTQDLVQRVELWGRYFISPNLQINASIPYVFNERSGEETIPFTIDGLGDVQLSVVYTLLNRSPLGTEWGHRVELGAGVKLPTGDYNPIQDDRLPDNMNLGTASLDWFFNATYILSQTRFGWSNNVSYRLNTENKYNYRFGNQFIVQSYAYYRLKSKQWQLVPYAGAYTELISQDELRGSSAHGTGGEGLFATVGIDIYFDQLNLSANGQIPVLQHYSDGEVEANSRFNISLAFLF